MNLFSLVTISTFAGVEGANEFLWMKSGVQKTPCFFWKESRVGSK